MEKKFEEKFGLKTEEMEEILGGVVSMAAYAVSSCVTCTLMCLVCWICVVCDVRTA